MLTGANMLHQECGQTMSNTVVDKMLVSTLQNVTAQINVQERIICRHDVTTCANKYDTAHNKQNQ